MAAVAHDDGPAPWPNHILNTYVHSPSALSTRSTSSTSPSTSIFSVDATSSQTSVSSISTAWSRSASDREDDESGEVQNGNQQQQQSRSLRTEILKGNAHPLSQRVYSPPLQPHATVVPAESRLNPRRTQRLNPSTSQDERTVSLQPRRPPALIHSSERKVNFVDTLVGKLMVKWLEGLRS